MTLRLTIAALCLPTLFLIVLAFYISQCYLTIYCFYYLFYFLLSVAGFHMSSIAAVRINVKSASNAENVITEILCTLEGGRRLQNSFMECV